MVIKVNSNKKIEYRFMIRLFDGYNIKMKLKNNNALELEGDFQRAKKLNEYMYKAKILF